MAPIIVHVGFPKSGSTLLQRFVFPVVKDVNFIQPDENKELFEALTLIEYPGGETCRLDVLSAASKHFQSSKNSTLISSEHFVMQGNWLTTHKSKPTIRLDTTQILSHIQKLGQQVRILLVIRKQQDWLESWYQERIKRYETRRFQDVVGAQEFFPIMELLRFDRTFLDLAQRFGKENVFIIPFELLKTDPQKLFHALGEAIGKPVPDLQLPVIRGRVRPRVLIARRSSNKLLVAVAGMTGGRTVIDEALFRMFKKIYAYDFLLGRGNSGKYNFGPLPDEKIKLYAQSNRSLEAITGLDLKGLGYY